MRNFKVIKAESLRTYTITDENSFEQSLIAHRETLVSVKVAKADNDTADSASEKETE